MVVVPELLQLFSVILFLRVVVFPDVGHCLFFCLKVQSFGSGLSGLSVHLSEFQVLQFLLLVLLFEFPVLFVQSIEFLLQVVDQKSYPPLILSMIVHS